MLTSWFSFLLATIHSLLMEDIRFQIAKRLDLAGQPGGIMLLARLYYYK